MARLTPFFSANRTVREYAEEHYIPAAEAYRSRLADDGALGKQLVQWKKSIELHWPTIRFGDARVETGNGWHRFSVQVYLGDLDSDAVRMELFTEPVEGGEPIRQKMERGEQLVAARGFIYTGRVPSSRPATDYTPRLVPFHAAARVPLEETRILWQR